MSGGNLRGAAAFLILLVCVGAAPVASAQEVVEVLETLRQQLGDPPRTLRLSGAGSGYDAAPDGGGRRHYRIERWSLEWDLERATAAEEVVRAVSSSAGEAPERSTESRAAAPDAPWRERYLYWMAPHTFLAGARAHGARLETRTQNGAERRAVAFTPPGGARVLGFLDGEGRLERIRTEIEDGSGGRSTREVVYFDVEDSTGSPFADILIAKHGGELARVVVIGEVEMAGRVEASAPPSGA